jgi:hypothetical protein
MKHALKMLVLAGSLALSLGACAALQKASPDVASDAIRATQVAITTYADVYQPAVIAYGNLPVCDGSTPICRDQAVHAKMKALDLAASTAIEAARKVMATNVGDSGELTAAIQAIMNAETTIAPAIAIIKR